MSEKPIKDLVRGLSEAKAPWSEKGEKITSDEIEKLELKKLSNEIRSFYNLKNVSTKKNEVLFFKFLIHACARENVSLDDVFLFLYEKKIEEVIDFETINKYYQEYILKIYRNNHELFEGFDWNTVSDYIRRHNYNRELRQANDPLLNKKGFVSSYYIDTGIYEYVYRIKFIQERSNELKDKMMRKSFVESETEHFNYGFATNVPEQYLRVDAEKLQEIVRKTQDLENEDFQQEILPSYAKAHSLEEIQSFITIFGEAILSEYRNYGMTELQCGKISSLIQLLSREFGIDSYLAVTHHGVYYEFSPLQSHHYVVLKIKNPKNNQSREYRIDATFNQFVQENAGLVITPRTKKKYQYINKSDKIGRASCRERV